MLEIHLTRVLVCRFSTKPGVIMLCCNNAHFVGTEHVFLYSFLLKAGSGSDISSVQYKLKS